MVSPALATKAGNALLPLAPRTEKTIDTLRQIGEVAIGTLSLMQNPASTLTGMAVGLVVMALTKTGASCARSNCETQIKENKAQATPQPIESEGVEKLKKDLQGIQMVETALSIVLLAGASLFAFYPQAPFQGFASGYLGFGAVTGTACLCVKSIVYLNARRASA